MPELQFIVPENNECALVREKKHSQGKAEFKV